MAANPLLEGKKSATTKCIFRAAEYAMIAEANGDHDKAKLWWKADRDGWDDEHFDAALSAEKRKNPMRFPRESKCG